MNPFPWKTKNRGNLSIGVAWILLESSTRVEAFE